MVLSLPGHPEWLHFGFALFSGSLVAALVHTARLRTLNNLETLRLLDQRHKTELEGVLRTTEDAQRSLATSMAVGQRITSILDLDTLLHQVAELIQSRFNCYFVGIFLLEPGSDRLDLRAASGANSRILLQQDFHLTVSEQSIVGWVAAHRRPACVEDVSQDPRYMFTELIPNARSELALPLEMGHTILGVLERLGVSATVLWTGFSSFAAVGAVAFFAAWSVLSNFFCALLIFTVRPFRLGDYIEVLDTAEKPGAKGRVIDINMLYTTLEDSTTTEGTGTGALLQIPNALIFQRVVRRWRVGVPVPVPPTAAMLAGHTAQQPQQPTSGSQTGAVAPATHLAPGPWR